MTVVINGDTGITSPADSLSGNLNFTGTGNRITGDFSNATVANRVAFQTSTVNGDTGIYAIPNGTGVTANVNVWNKSSLTAASGLNLLVNASEASLRSNITDGGSTYLPMTFYTGGSERMRIDTSGNVGIGTSNPLTTLTLGNSKYLSWPNTAGSLSATTGSAIFKYSDNYLYIDNLDATAICFRRANYVESMRIDSSGNVGIGVAPSYPLHVRKDQASADTWITAQNGTSTSVYGAGFLAYQGTSGANYSYFRQGADSNTYFVNAANGAAIFATNSAERMRIDSSGNLLVGTTTPSNGGSTLTKNSPNGLALTAINYSTTNGYGIDAVSATAGGTGWALYRGFSDTTTLRFLVYGNGNVVNGNNSYGGISDIKLKENITNAGPKLEEICAIRVVNYNLIGDSQKQIGVIAQEVEQIFPGMIDESPDVDADGNDLGTTTKSVKYSVFVPMLIKAIQEQQAIMEQLRADVAQLKGQA